MARKKMTAAEKKAFVERMRKARAAKSKKPTTARKSTRKTATKKTARKNPTTSKYVLRIVTRVGEVGYLVKWNKGTSAVYDTEMSKALASDKRAMDTIARLVQIARPLGIASVEVVKK